MRSTAPSILVDSRSIVTVDSGEVDRSIVLVRSSEFSSKSLIYNKCISVIVDKYVITGSIGLTVDLSTPAIERDAHADLVSKHGKTPTPKKDSGAGSGGFDSKSRPWESPHAVVTSGVIIVAEMRAATPPRLNAFGDLRPDIQHNLQEDPGAMKTLAGSTNRAMRNWT